MIVKSDFSEVREYSRFINATDIEISGTVDKGIQLDSCGYPTHFIFLRENKVL